MPAIVQDADSGAVLMLAYMNREALEQTLARKRAVFFSRSKQRLWEKGETTGHTLDVVDVALDCDNDTLLVTARPRGPACHNGTLTCFGDEPRSAATRIAFLAKLEGVIAQRATEKPEASYTATPARQGRRRASRRRSAKKAWSSRWPASATRARQGRRGIRRPAVPPAGAAARARRLRLSQVVGQLESRHQPR